MLKIAGRATRARLTSFLAIKSVAEVLFVCALAVGFYLTAFAPVFRGALDSADARHVEGWVVNRAEPQARVYAVHASGGEQKRTLQLIGKPLRFSVAAD